MYKIPCMLMRSGTSKGVYIHKEHLPKETAERDRLLLKLMGSPHIKQIDGLGYGDPLTSKVAILSKSNRLGADLDFLFAQVMVDREEVSTEANCGNITAGIAYYAIETGLIKADSPSTKIKVFNENTSSIVEIIINTPNGEICYEGDTSIDGVPGTGSPIYLNFPDSVGKNFGKILPTGNVIDIIANTPITFVDAAIPVIFIDAKSLNKTGYETKMELDQDKKLIERITEIRNLTLEKIGRGKSNLIPKVSLVSPPIKNGNINSRYFTPFTCHAAHAVTGALCIGIASFIPGTIPNKLCKISNTSEVSIEHPSGKIDVKIEFESIETYKPSMASFVRTARPLFHGQGVIV